MLAVAFGSATATAAADAVPVRVELVAPESCPSRPTLFERVRSHTPRAREATADESSRALRVVIVPEAGRFAAELRLVEGGESLERRVAGDTCEEVLAAVALIVALTIDPLATSAPLDTDAEGAEPTPPPEPPAPSAPGRDEDARSSRSRASASISPDASERRRRPTRSAARVDASFGTSLEAYGLGEAVLGRGIWAEASLRGRASPALRLRLSRTQSFTVEREMRPAFFTLTTMGADGCVTALRNERRADDLEPLVLRPCAQVSAGILEASSAAFGPVHRTRRPWLSIGAVLQARWRLVGPLALESAGGIAAPLVRDDFYFLPRTHMYRPPGAVLVGNVGIGATFR